MVCRHTLEVTVTVVSLFHSHIHCIESYRRFHLVCRGIKFGERNFFCAWYKLKLICVLYFQFVPSTEKVSLAIFFPETNQVESTIVIHTRSFHHPFMQQTPCCNTYSTWWKVYPGFPRGLPSLTPAPFPPHARPDGNQIVSLLCEHFY